MEVIRFLREECAREYWMKRGMWAVVGMGEFRSRILLEFVEMGELEFHEIFICGGRIDKNSRGMVMYLQGIGQRAIL